MAKGAKVSTEDGRQWTVFSIGGADTLTDRAEWITVAVCDEDGTERSFTSDLPGMDIPDHVLSECIQKADAIAPEVLAGWQVRRQDVFIAPPARFHKAGEGPLTGVGTVEIGGSALLKTNDRCEVTVEVSEAFGPSLYFGVVTAVDGCPEKERESIGRRVAFHKRHVFAQVI